MANIQINGSNLGNVLQELLMCDDLEAGDTVSYQLCKTIFLFHPLGLKMAAAPIMMAQSQEREINVPDSPEEDVKEAFRREWEALGCSTIILNVMTQSRVYGVASVVLGAEGIGTAEPIPPEQLAKLQIFFNVLDPLNTAGSLVLSQDPNSPAFQKHTVVTASGEPYHRSRSCVIMNEQPIFLAYTGSAFGYVGRSIYQRALLPLKSFVQSMITDDMVTRKAGVLIAKIKQPGSIIDNLMAKLAGVKRALLQEAKTDNVLSIAPEESIETLNMMNVDGAYGIARKNILENIAVSADMPAKMLNAETFAEGFGEGTEDAKNVARYIDRIRETMQPLYAWFDNIVQFRAWNTEFYEVIQNKYSDYKNVSYNEAFYKWKNSFEASWPSLLTEPPSEKIKVDEVKLKSFISLVEVIAPQIDQNNRAELLKWLADNINELKEIFKSPLELDWEAIASYEPPVNDMAAEKEPNEPKPESLSSRSDAIATVKQLVSARR